MVNTTHSSLVSDTRKQVKDLRSSSLCMTMSEIAKRVGISRQRVYQILRKDGFPTKHRVHKNQYECLVCGTPSEYKLCSKKCKKKWQQIPVTCTRCGKLFFRNKHEFLHNYKNHGFALFCSRHCVGKWLAENYNNTVKKEMLP